MLCQNCGVEMDPMTHLRENCLGNQLENLDSQLTHQHAQVKMAEDIFREMITDPQIGNLEAYKAKIQDFFKGGRH